MNINKQLRINERIRVRDVRLIDEEGRQAGVVPTRDALQRAKDVGMDLIEVAPTAVPPVCRIMDYGKFKYEQAKRERDASKRSAQTELRMIRVRPNIDDHDFEVKLKNARKFLEDGDKTRIFVVFRSREFTHPEFGRKLLSKFLEGLSDISAVEKPIGMEGRQMSLMLAPKSKLAPKPQQMAPTKPRPEPKGPGIRPDGRPPGARSESRPPVVKSEDSQPGAKPQAAESAAGEKQ